MNSTALQHAKTGPSREEELDSELANHRGGAAPGVLSDLQAEFSALRNRCGVYDLSFRAKISLTGGDRTRWLNGMVTNNVRDLEVGHGAYAFLLNPQGHILGDLTAYNRGDVVIVDTDRSQLEKILATFDHYIIMDDVEVKDLSDSLTAIGVAGPQSRAVLQRAGITMPDLSPLQVATPKCDCQCSCLECTVVRGEDPEHESYEIWIAPSSVKQLWGALLEAGATAVGSEALEMQRIVSGTPLYGVDIRERDLPQETEQARALNFNKGCYVGQEIVERIRSRGNVHRKFTGFTSNDGTNIVRGAKVVVEEKEVGEITSVTSLRGDRICALGYIRREFAVPGKEVSIGTTKAAVSVLPFAEIS
jgi:folate-binding protein YgfZ